MKVKFKILGIIMLSILTISGFAQKKMQLSKADSKIIVKGTSTLHDWEINCENFSGVADVDTNASSIQINKTSLEIIVKSMKSGEGSSMDEVVYDAMKADKYSTVKYDFTEISNIQGANGDFEGVVSGRLTIAGVTKILKVKVNMKIVNGILTVTGKSKFKMSTFGIDPPKAMFGMIKSGDLIEIEFTLKYK